MLAQITEIHETSAWKDQEGEFVELVEKTIVYDNHKNSEYYGYFNGDVIFQQGIFDVDEIEQPCFICAFKFKAII